MKDDQQLMEGLNVHRGKVTYQAVAEDQGYDYLDPREAIAPQGFAG